MSLFDVLVKFSLYGSLAIGVASVVVGGAIAWTDYRRSRLKRKRP